MLKIALPTRGVKAAPVWIQAGPLLHCSAGLLY